LYKTETVIGQLKYKISKCNELIISKRGSGTYNLQIIHDRLAVAFLTVATAPTLDLGRFNSGTKIGFRFRLSVQAPA
jgi:hypothetical protein